jgi:hypothetical protein
LVDLVTLVQEGRAGLPKSSWEGLCHSQAAEEGAEDSHRQARQAAAESAATLHQLAPIATGHDW